MSTPPRVQRGARTYWYDTYRVGSDVMKKYIGEDSDELRARLDRLTDLSSGAVSQDDARGRRDSLQNALAAIYKSAPGTTPKAYGMAQQGLQKLEDYTFNPGEIDKFLPPSLKRG